MSHSSAHAARQPERVTPANFQSSDTFLNRHIGPSTVEQKTMLEALGLESLDELADAAVPAEIRLRKPLNLPSPVSEHVALSELKQICARNQIFRSCIGMGYSDCITPPVIRRNILENPGWYTAYTPYQAEIAQGRLEALLNFQTMITDLTGLEIANASMLDEATAAAEAMTMCYAVRKNNDARTFFVSKHCHPQTIAVVRTRAEPLGLELVVADENEFAFSNSIFAVLLQYPRTDGLICDYAPIIARAKKAGALTIMAPDILCLALLKSPGELGADVAVGSTQRFGVPLGYGGPHAAYFATREAFKRQMPGRLVGASHDAFGRTAYRLALQTREQHIRREKATSNICTAQVLLAVIASMYAVYHGPEGLRRIARHVHGAAEHLSGMLMAAGFTILNGEFFDTVGVQLDSAAQRDAILKRAADSRINLRAFGEAAVLMALDETTMPQDLSEIVAAFSDTQPSEVDDTIFSQVEFGFRDFFLRSSPFLTHPVFNRYHTETEMLRYIRRLEARDLSLTTSMIPLGSCTMKLNATAEMLPISWEEVARLHPYAPESQTGGYQLLIGQLEQWLAEITGFAAVSLQPNAGSQGEYAGLLAIRAYHASRGEAARNVCLIPQSAHGTNPASAVLAGFRVVPVHCVSEGDIDMDDLRAKAEEHAADLACIMVTYPSTHGVFEETITEVCDVIHAHGGQVYMDGANMNAQVGLCRPGDIGADVCHLNLHKTFCIPHGGGGPGMGPIGVAEHLVEFLPQHPLAGNSGRCGAVSAAPWGSASILVIPWMYIRMMGAYGLTEATKVAILNANYVARRLESYFPVLFKGKNGLVAHECILDVRRWKNAAGIEVEDIAKRLIDYGFHAPTVSWPVPGTMMVEPTESESKDELDRFCDAMISIHEEIRAIETGSMDRTNNPLKNAPHTAESIADDQWDRPYSRKKAAFPAPWLPAHKFWPAVGRIDNVYGDRHLVCSCPPMEEWV
jgi:glycine dehydrogenase